MTLVIGLYVLYVTSSSLQRRRKGLTRVFVQRIRMDLSGLPFERFECLEGTWTPMMVMGEDHFVGTVCHTVYTPGAFSYTTQILKTIQLALPRVPYTHGPDEFIEISSDSS